MPLVFVHGVSVRAGASYDRQLEFRDESLKRHVLRRTDATILNPYWGDLGAAAAWEHASLPGERLLVLGALGQQDPVPVEQVLKAEEAAGYTRPRSVLLEVARQDFEEAVALLISTAVEESGIEAQELVRVATLLHDYAAAVPKPDWVHEVANDYTFLERLRWESAQWQGPTAGPASPGAPRAAADAEARDPEAMAEADAAVWDGMRAAIERIRDAIANWHWGQPGRSLRRTIQPYVTNFFGDIFVYLKSRGTLERPGGIVERITASLRSAAALTSATDPLIVVSHSMGAAIAYDVLSHFATDVEVDTLVTVGSQVSWFEEMKLFASSDPAIPNAKHRRAPKPQNLRRWLNVIDTSDYLSYATEPIFAGATDLTFDSGRGPLAAHTEYFKDVGFYQLLGEELAGVRERRLDGVA